LQALADRWAGERLQRGGQFIGIVRQRVEVAAANYGLIRIVRSIGTERRIRVDAHLRFDDRDLQADVDGLSLAYRHLHLSIIGNRKTRRRRMDGVLSRSQSIE